MSDKDKKTEQETAQQPDSLSATGMFLRAFEPGSGSSKETVPGATQDTFEPKMAGKPALPANANVPSSSSAAGVPGEFTQMFQRPVAAPRASAKADPKPAQASPGQAAGSGEFTRLFVGGADPAAKGAAKRTESAGRVVSQAPAMPAGAKGFSTPGVSDSASGEGTFTHLFRSPNAGTPAAPPTPAPVSSVESLLNDEPPMRVNREPSRPREMAEPGITKIFSSLSSPEASGAFAGTSQDAPYRPSPPPVFAPAASHGAPPADDMSGVTRLIQRLAQEEAAAAPPLPARATAPVAPQENSEPGEFTRIISKLAAEKPAAVPPQPLARQPAPVNPLPIPPIPPPFKMSAPPMPAMPSAPGPAVFGAPLIPQPIAAPPAMVAPAIPKPPALPSPALAKGKFDGLVPILLVINTFLLLLILLVVVFAAKSH